MSCVCKRAGSKVRFDAKLSYCDLQYPDMEEGNGSYRSSRKRSPKPVNMQKWLNDSSERASRRIDSTRGRAKSILMVSQEHHDIDRVLVVVGPKFDLEMTMASLDDLDEEGGEWFYEEPVRRVPGRFGVKGTNVHHRANRDGRQRSEVHHGHG